MGRLEPTKETIRSLFAKSGNLCAFPGCVRHLIDDDNKYVAQICHIEAAEEGGQRFNSASTDEERRHYDNLVLLCYEHHVETNDEAKYPVSILRKIKLDHERTYGTKTFKIDEAHLYKLAAAATAYWERIDYLRKIAEQTHEFPVDISATETFFDLLTRLKEQIAWIKDRFKDIDESEDALPDDLHSFFEKLGLDPGLISKVHYQDNPFEIRNWEIRKIGFHNSMVNMNAIVAQIEIKFLEEYLKTNPHDGVKKLQLQEAQRNFEAIVSKTGYVD